MYLNPEKNIYFDFSSILYFGMTLDIMEKKLKLEHLKFLSFFKKRFPHKINKIPPYTLKVIFLPNSAKKITNVQKFKCRSPI